MNHHTLLQASNQPILLLLLNIDFLNRFILEYFNTLINSTLIFSSDKKYVSDLTLFSLDSSANISILSLKHFMIKNGDKILIFL